MAQAHVHLDTQTISCPICLDLLKDPVSTSCGHSYCLSCITSHWDTEDKKGIYSCPQCRKGFIPRPKLQKNTTLAAVVEQLKKTGVQAAPADHRCYAGAKDVACDVCTGRKLKALKSCLVCLVSYCENHLQFHLKSPAFAKHKLVEPSNNLRDDELIEQSIRQRIQDREEELKELQQEVKDIRLSADVAVRHSQNIYSQLILLIKKWSCEVEQQIRSQQEAAVRQLQELEEKLEQKLSELRSKAVELQQLSHTEDHCHFPQHYSSASVQAASTGSSSHRIRPGRHFEDVKAAVSEGSQKIQRLLSDSWTNISPTEVKLSPAAEPTTREEFLRYSADLTMDPNTAHTRMLLSGGNTRATRIENQPPPYDHPDRFRDLWQVLSRESLTGRCYWEVKVREGRGSVAVAYKNISRAGPESGFGFNDKSWALHCSNPMYGYWFNGVKSEVSGPWSDTVGVYLDHAAGLLSFYSVSDSMTLLHTVHTSFTQPLHAGLWLDRRVASSCELVKLG